MTPAQHIRILLLALSTLLAAPVWSHGGEDHDEPAAPSKPAQTLATSAMGTPRRLPDGSLWVPKPVQHKLALRTQVALTQDHAPALELNGTVQADPNAGGRIPASQAGRIEAGPMGLPSLGQRISRGQVLAYLRPVLSSVEQGNQQAALADLDAQYEVAERKLARYRQLEGSVPAKDIDAARIEQDALRKRRGALRASLGAPEALTAPVSGVIAASHVVLGQLVDARESLFDIVDPTRLMVEALAYDPTQAAHLGEASASVPGGIVSMRFAGAGALLQEQALPLRFRVVSSTAPLAVGQTLHLNARTTGKVRGAAIPRSALIRLNGSDTMVWLHDAPERFVARPVRVAPLDAEHVVVTQGLHDKDRVVTRGASLLAQIR